MSKPQKRKTTKPTSAKTKAAKAAKTTKTTKAAKTKAATKATKTKTKPARRRPPVQAVTIEWVEGRWAVVHKAIGVLWAGDTPCAAHDETKEAVSKVLTLLWSYGARGAIDDLGPIINHLADDLHRAHLAAHVAETALIQARQNNTLA